MSYKVRFGKKARGALYRGCWVIETNWRRWRWGRTRRDTFDWYVGPLRLLVGRSTRDPGEGCGEFAGCNTLVMRCWMAGMASCV